MKRAHVLAKHPPGRRAPPSRGIQLIRKRFNHHKTNKLSSAANLRFWSDYTESSHLHFPAGVKNKLKYCLPPKRVPSIPSEKHAFCRRAVCGAAERSAAASGVAKAKGEGQLPSQPEAWWPLSTRVTFSVLAIWSAAIRNDSVLTTHKPRGLARDRRWGHRDQGEPLGRRAHGAEDRLG